MIVQLESDTLRKLASKNDFCGCCRPITIAFPCPSKPSYISGETWQRQVTNHLSTTSTAVWKSYLPLRNVVMLYFFNKGPKWILTDHKISFSTLWFSFCYIFCTIRGVKKYIWIFLSKIDFLTDVRSHMKRARAYPY